MWAYIKLIPYAAIMILLAALLYFRYQVADRETEIARLEATNKTLQQTNDDQQKTIKRMVELRENEQKILLDLSNSIDTINTSVEETKNSISDLGQANTDVKEFLSRFVPPDLNKLLNK